MKILLIIFLTLILGCESQAHKENMEYIKWLGDRALDMSIGGDSDAYETLLWAKKNNEHTKQRLEEHYKNYQKEREKENKKVCLDKTTEGYEKKCEGWWHTFVHNGEIYNCLPQIDHGNLDDDDICYEGKQFSCYVNLGKSTKKKIEKSCKCNKQLEEQFSGTFSIPKTLEHQPCYKK